MANTPIPKTNPEFDLMDLAGIGIAKVASERALSRIRFVGNSTYRSGIIKLVLAGVAYGVSRKATGFGKRLGNWTSVAWAVDGMEDVITNGFKQFNVGNISSPNNRTMEAI